MRLGPYSVLTFLGTLPWCFGLRRRRLRLGEGWERFHDNFRYADYVILALIVAGDRRGSCSARSLAGAGGAVRPCELD